MEKRNERLNTAVRYIATATLILRIIDAIGKILTNVRELYEAVSALIH